ncbi:MAG: hypothetical protein V3S44_01780 [Alphaproteobacteria bacterium]
MKMIPFLAAVLIATLLGACSNIQPVAYVPIDEIPPGPGLFSGEDGEFVIRGK